jgi:hypothetical protein
MMLLVPFAVVVLLMRLIFIAMPSGDFLAYPDKVGEFWTVIGVTLGNIASAFGLTGSPDILHVVVLVMIGFATVFFFGRAALHWKIGLFVLISAKILEALTL